MLFAVTPLAELTDTFLVAVISDEASTSECLKAVSTGFDASKVSSGLGSLAGLLASITFAAIVLLLAYSRRSDLGDDAQGTDLHEITGRGIRFLVIAFVVLIVDTFVFETSAGFSRETSPVSLPASGQLMDASGGVLLAVGVLLLLLAMNWIVLDYLPTGTAGSARATTLAAVLRTSGFALRIVSVLTVVLLWVSFTDVLRSEAGAISVVTSWVPSVGALATGVILVFVLPKAWMRRADVSPASSDRWAVASAWGVTLGAIGLFVWDSQSSAESPVLRPGMWCDQPVPTGAWVALAIACTMVVALVFAITLAMPTEASIPTTPEPKPEPPTHRVEPDKIYLTSRGSIEWARIELRILTRRKRPTRNPQSRDH